MHIQHKGCLFHFRHAIFPIKGHQHRHAALSTMILEKKHAPVSLRRFDHAALGHPPEGAVQIILQHFAAHKFAGEAV